MTPMPEPPACDGSRNSSTCARFSACSGLVRTTSGRRCGSSSLAAEWVKGKTGSEALSIKNTDIVRELSLPPVKIHCSVLAEDAIKAAIRNWKTKHGVEAAAEEKVAH